ncbi:MAG: NupC/NupG family nucleoside CNT transporter [Oceanipulchritudo sp.]
MDTLVVILRGLFGIAGLTGLCWLFSRDRRAVDWPLVVSGLVFQLVLAILVLRVPHADKPIEWISGFFVALLSFSDEGTRFVFGFLGAGPDFWEEVNAAIGNGGFPGFGLIFAFKVLPTVIFFSALTSVLYYLGWLQVLVKGFAWLLQRSMRLSGSESLAAKILLPQTETVDHELRVSREKMGENVFDAACQGTTQGLMLALNIGAMLITFLAFIALINFLIGTAGTATGLDSRISAWTSGAYDGLSLELLFGLLFAPVAWLIGIGWGDLLSIGQLLGIKLVANEFVAYEQMGHMMAVEGTLSQRSVVIATYALCGFANFSSMGIQIGGIAVLAPSQRGNLSRLALLSVAGGTAACLYTGAIAGMFV